MGCHLCIRSWHNQIVLLLILSVFPQKIRLFHWPTQLLLSFFFLPSYVLTGENQKRKYSHLVSSPVVVQVPMQKKVFYRIYLWLWQHPYLPYYAPCANAKVTRSYFNLITQGTVMLERLLFYSYAPLLLHFDLKSVEPTSVLVLWILFGFWGSPVRLI